MWSEMEAYATIDEVNRVAAVVRSQFRHVSGLLQPEDPNCLAIFEREMTTAQYETIRERQLRELELNDALMAKQPVKLSSRVLYK